VNQVMAMKQGNTGEVFKAARDKVIIVTDTANAWVRVKTRDNGIRIFLSHQCYLFNVQSLADSIGFSRLAIITEDEPTKSGHS
jgi:hypothetical protein